MAVSKSLTKIDDLTWRLIPNWQNEDGQYTQWAVKMTGWATDGSGTKEPVCEIEDYGTYQDSKYTAKQLYSFIAGQTNLHTVLANAMKTMYINAINEDLST